MNKSGYKRHFLKPDEIIELNDTKIVVSTQWGIGNIDNFIQNAKNLNYEINDKIE